jgi:hypothetical protein
MARRIHCLGFGVLALFALTGAAVAEQELKDTAYFSGMPNYQIYESDEKEFDAYNFFNGKACVTV